MLSELIDSEKTIKALQRYNVTYIPGFVLFFRWVISCGESESCNIFRVFMKNKALHRELKRHKISLETFRKYGKFKYLGHAIGTKGELFFHMHGVDQPMFHICSMGIGGLVPGSGQTDIYNHKSVHYQRRVYWGQWMFCTCGHEDVNLSGNLQEHISHHKNRKEKFTMTINIPYGGARVLGYDFRNSNNVTCYTRSRYKTQDFIGERPISLADFYIKSLEKK